MSTQPHELSCANQLTCDERECLSFAPLLTLLVLLPEGPVVLESEGRGNHYRGGTSVHN